MKEIITLTVKLLLICLIITGLLALVNNVTEPIIAENNEANFQAAMTEVLPSSATFTPLSTEGFLPSEEGVKVESAYSGENGGYVVSTVCSEGYGGDINVMVGINLDSTISQIKIMSMSETPGLGAKAADTAYTDQYRYLAKGISVIKNAPATDNSVVAISGATRTSKAVTKAVNAALEAAAYLTEKGA